MTERTIMMTAKEYAGVFYEQKRSDRFRSKDSKTRIKRMVRDERTGLMVERVFIVPFFEAFPTSKAFAEAHWPLFVDAARKSLVTMLALPDARISPALKEGIMAAIVEDRQREYRGAGKRLIQAKV